MEGKQRSLLLIKSATALNSLLIFSIVCVVFYHHQRVAELELKVLIYHNVERFSENGKQFSSLLPPKENQKAWGTALVNGRINQPQHLRRRAREATKDDRSNVWNAPSINGGRGERKDSNRKPRSPRVNTTHTIHCSRCLKECFELGSQKVSNLYEARVSRNFCRILLNVLIKTISQNSSLRVHQLLIYFWV